MYKVTKFCGIILDSKRGISIRAELSGHVVVILDPKFCGRFLFAVHLFFFSFWWDKLWILLSDLNINVCFFQRKPQVHSDHLFFFNRCLGFVYLVLGAIPDFISVFVCFYWHSGICMVFIYYFQDKSTRWSTGLVIATSFS